MHIRDEAFLSKSLPGGPHPREAAQLIFLPDGGRMLSGQKCLYLWTPVARFQPSVSFLSCCMLDTFKMIAVLHQTSPSCLRGGLISAAWFPFTERGSLCFVLHTHGCLGPRHTGLASGAGALLQTLLFSSELLVLVLPETAFRFSSRVGGRPRCARSG